MNPHNEDQSRNMNTSSLQPKFASGKRSAKYPRREDHPRTFLSEPELWGVIEIEPCQTCGSEEGEVYRYDGFEGFAAFTNCDVCGEPLDKLTMCSLAALVYSSASFELKDQFRQQNIEGSADE